jgi:hypothetical protein
MILTGHQQRGYGLARTSDGRPTMVEGTFRAEQRDIDLTGPCPCTIFNRENRGFGAVMCMWCEGPVPRLIGTDSDS